MTDPSLRDAAAASPTASLLGTPLLSGNGTDPMPRRKTIDARPPMERSHGSTKPGPAPEEESGSHTPALCRGIVRICQRIVRRPQTPPETFPLNPKRPTTPTVWCRKVMSPATENCRKWQRKGTKMKAQKPPVHKSLHNLHTPFGRTKPAMRGRCLARRSCHPRKIVEENSASSCRHHDPRT